MNKAVVIGSGFAGLSAASFLARDGWDVTVLEKNATPGGRGRQFSAEGFTFDMGPSWYWMPDVFERYFQQFGKSVSDYYTLERLDPSYRIYSKDSSVDIPADYKSLCNLFEQLEPGSSEQLDAFLREAAYKYKVGMQKLVHKPGLSVTELIDWEVISQLGRLDVFTSMSKHVARFFRHPLLREMMEFPVLFLGALASDTPALYSLMNYADIVGGTWYPKGGMYKIVEGMYSLAVELGVKFEFGVPVEQIILKNGKATGVQTTKGFFPADAVVGAADYNHVEQKLLPSQYRSYSTKYWEERMMAPSCLLYYVGVNKRIPGLTHHSLFFDADFGLHGKEIYQTPQWPTHPLFYMGVPSVTDPSVAPAGCENLFLLIPVASGLQNDSTELRESYFEGIITRVEERSGTSIRDSIVYKRSFALSDFVQEYNSYKGNAYGLANTLMQTAVLKPRCRSKKVSNLFYAGQLTVPGPGVPPSLISGEVVSRTVVKAFAR